MDQPSPAAPPAARRRVLWLPADPAEGGASMDRHWRDLDTQVRRRPPDELTITSPFPAGPPAGSRRGPRLARAWRKYVAYPRAAKTKARHADVVHILDHSFAHLLRGLPASVYKIVTVHDLAPLRDPRGLTASQLARFRRTVQNLLLADLLLADSAHTARDAVDLIGCLPDKVKVLPLGVDVDIFAAPRPTPAWWPPGDGQRLVIVSVGSAAPRKNLELLPAVFRAMMTVGGAGPAPALVRVGQNLPETLATELRAVLGPDGLVERGAADDGELASIYQHAHALIFPSTLEGFGLPVLEAMAAGCPVVSSDASSLPEVGGAAALYFAPDNAAAAAVHLLRLRDDAPFRVERIAAGRAQAQSLDWAHHWQKLLPVYRR